VKHSTEKNDTTKSDNTSGSQKACKRGLKIKQITNISAAWKCYNDINRVTGDTTTPKPVGVENTENSSFQGFYQWK
jgi:hypothetical protein